jgi:hypothetical protein
MLLCNIILKTIILLKYYELQALFLLVFFCRFASGNYKKILQKILQEYFFLYVFSLRTETARSRTILYEILQGTLIC